MHQSVQPQVAEHYNQIRQKSREERQSSEILGVKRFNNWVKSVLIQRFTVPAAAALDICCGKGGDLLKFKKANVRQYVGADHALQSIKDAMQRYNEVNPLPFHATFICADCHSTPLAPAIPAGMLFDIVSCQFALHYSFESEARARMFARNIAARLKPGGTFVATFPSADVLQQKLAATVEAQRERSAQRMAQAAATGKPEEPRPLRLEFGNSVYKVKFTSPCPLVLEQNPVASAAAAAASSSAAAAAPSAPNLLPGPVPPLPSSPFGVQYTFDLTDAIAECPEYMVPMSTLCSLMEAHDCELVLCSSMHQFFLDHAQHEEYGRLLKQMKVLGNEYERPPTRDEWEVLNVYLAVAFRKRMPGEIPGSHQDVATAVHAPATSCLHRKAPPATPWQNMTKQDEQQMQLHRLSHADIKIIKPQTTH